MCDHSLDRICDACRLVEDLEEADRYREAYNNLIQEVDALIARNALAEEEAHRLSRFNAEILGHNNPAQRIVYVDKIRRELHETKQVCSNGPVLPFFVLIPPCRNSFCPSGTAMQCR